MTKPRLSASSINKWEQCPRLWYHIYIQKMVSVPGYHAVLGTFVHSVFEKLFQLPADQRTIETARKLARSIYDTLPEDEDFQYLELNEDECTQFRREAWVHIKNLWSLENPEKTVVKSTEQKFEIEDDDFSIVGFIDRVDQAGDKVQIVDYKTGKKPAQKYQGDAIRQIRIYAYASTELWDEPVDKASLYYTAHGILSEDVDQRKLNAIKKKLKAVAAEITESEQQGYEAKTGPLCAWCPAVDQCPEGQEKVDELWKAQRVRIDAPALLMLGYIK